MRKLQSNGFGMVEVVIVIITIGLLSGGGYYIYTQRENQKNDNKADTAQTSQTEDDTAEVQEEKTTFATGEEKADYFVETMKDLTVDSFETSPELYDLLVEMDTYAGYDQGLTGDEQKQFASSLGVLVGLYGDFFTKGTVTKVASSTEDNALKLTVTEYEGNDPTSKAFTGVYNFTVKTAFIDDSWRIVDYTVEKAQ